MTLNEAEFAALQRFLDAGAELQPAGDEPFIPEAGDSTFCNFLTELEAHVNRMTVEDGVYSSATGDLVHQLMHWAFVFGIGYNTQFEGEPPN